VTDVDPKDRERELLLEHLIRKHLDRPIVMEEEEARRLAAEQVAAMNEPGGWLGRQRAPAQPRPWWRRLLRLP
jgi:hypothetical protein